VPKNLAKFPKSNNALSQFGMIKGMALPILFFPSAILNSVSTLLIPEISEAVARNRPSIVRDCTKKIIKFTSLTGFLFGAIFLFCGEKIGILIYGDSSVGFLLKALSPIVPLMYLESVTAGLLKGLDRQMNMLRFNSFDSIVRIASVFFLLPLFGIKAYLGIMIVSNCFTSCLSARCLFKTTETSPDLLRWVVFPLSVGVVSGFLAKFCTSFINSTLIRLIVTLSIQALLSAIYWFYSCKQKWRVVK
jgi:stage V sporulation protein B